LPLDQPDTVERPLAARSLPSQDESPTLARIRDAARSLFYSQGYHATSVGEIARMAGLSRAAVYLHFATKDEMLVAILRQDLGDQLAHFRRLANLASVDRASLTQWIGTLQRAMDRHRASLNLFALAFDMSAGLKAQVDNHRDAAIAVLGQRFAGFDLDALDRPSREQRRIACYMMLFIIEGATMTFSGTTASPAMDTAAEQLAPMLLHFLETGEIRSAPDVA
jgi:AcrR family transcriptional regulator